MTKCILLGTPRTQPLHSASRGIEVFSVSLSVFLSLPVSHTPAHVHTQAESCPDLGNKTLIFHQLYIYLLPRTHEIVCYLRFLKNKHKTSDKKYKRANINDLLLKEYPLGKRKLIQRKNLENMNKQ